MPYSSIDELPEFIKSVLPVSAQKIFVKVFNKAYEDSGGDDVFAMKVAWAIIKKRYKKEGHKWVAKSKDFQMRHYVYYKFKPTKVYMKKNKDDYVYVEAILSSTNKDYHGQEVTYQALVNFSEQINKRKIKGKFDNHKITEMLMMKGYSMDKIQTILSKISPNIQLIQAYIDKNVLKGIIRLKKKYLPLLKKYNGISLEFRVPDYLLRDNKIYGGDIISFTFTDKPANPDSYVLNIAM